VKGSQTPRKSIRQPIWGISGAAQRANSIRKLDCFGRSQGQTQRKFTGSESGPKLAARDQIFKNSSRNFFNQMMGLITNHSSFIIDHQALFIDH